MVESADVMKIIGIKPITADDLARMQWHRTAVVLSQPLTDFKMIEIRLADCLEFLSDVTGVPVRLDEKALDKPKDKAAARVVDTRLYNLPSTLLLELVANEMGAVCLTDGQTVVLTSPAAAAGMKGFEPLVSLRKMNDGKANLRSLQAQLSRKLPEFSLNNMAMRDVIEFFRDLSGSNIHVDARAIREAGIDLNSPINADFRNQPFRQALSALTMPSPKLAVYVHEGQVIVVTTRVKAEAAAKASELSVMIAPEPAKKDKQP